MEVIKEIKVAQHKRCKLCNKSLDRPEASLDWGKKHICFSCLGLLGGVWGRLQELRVGVDGYTEAERMGLKKKNELERMGLMQKSKWRRVLYWIGHILQEWAIRRD